jgi:hypothetical protein
MAIRSAYCPQTFSQALAVGSTRLYDIATRSPQLGNFLANARE